MPTSMHPAYFETHFTVDDPTRDWPEAFTIITAYATTGEQWTASENEAADQALADLLRADNALICRIKGFSPTSGHAEPGWATTLDWESACDLGAQFLQDAIYIVSGDELLVSYCDDRRALVPVGCFRERLSRHNPAQP